MWLDDIQVAVKRLLTICKCTHAHTCENMCVCVGGEVIDSIGLVCIGNYLNQRQNNNSQILIVSVQVIYYDTLENISQLTRYSLILLDY